MPANRRSRAEGWHGWDEYAPFYDWENARTMGRQDVRFWQALARRTGGRALELGCGTGRVLVPLARAGVHITGVDRSAEMLKRARLRLRRARLPVRLVRGDIRTLPWRDGAFDLVLAPYGILQSLLRDRDLAGTLGSAFRALRPGGTFACELVPDVPKWREYTNRVTLTGRRGPDGRPLALRETVRQDRARRLTIFENEFVEGWGRQRTVHRFTVTFRTLPVQAMCGRIERAGFTVDALLGDYDGKPWDPCADAWLIVARKPR